MATSVHLAHSSTPANLAFLQEIREVNEELWQLLDNIRALVGAAADVQEHAAPLTDMLIELRDQLALHFALEEAFGYFDEMLTAIPSATRQVARMRSEHRQLYAQASRLADAAELLLFGGNLPDFIIRIPPRFLELEQELRRHESRENELLMSQFDDVGEVD